MEMEAAFDNNYQQQDNSYQEPKSNNYNSYNSYKNNNNNNGYKKNFNKSNYWNNKGKTKKSSFEKTEIPVIKVDTNKPNFLVDYKLYTIDIVKTVTFIDGRVLERLRTIVEKLESKGYLYRGSDLVDSAYPLELKDSRRPVMDLIKEIDRFYSTTQFLYDNKKAKTFSIVKGLSEHYSNMKDTVKNILARDLEILIGENHNKPLKLAIYVGGDDNSFIDNLNYNKLQNIYFSVKSCKTFNIPAFNICLDEDWDNLVNFVDALPLPGSSSISGRTTTDTNDMQ